MTELPRVLGGRYEVGDLIGRGGMAQVHLGYDTRLSRTVAIKVLRSDLAQDPTFLARFRREAQSAAALNHPSIVAVYDTGEEVLTSHTGKKTQLPYIVMEYVKGRTVSGLLSTGDPVPIGEAVQIVAGVLSALEYSHHEGIVHRDIKPGNIMLTADGKVKVMDFGIARAIADSAATMTQTNSVVGTAQYLSPEQARGEVVDARSDLYSAGCLLYELLTGRPPFQGDSAVAVAYQHVSEAPKPASSIASDIPDAIDRVVMKSLAKQRDARYQTAAEMRSDLLAAARGEGVHAPDIATWQNVAVVPTPPVATQIVPPRPSTTTQTATTPNGPGWGTVVGGNSVTATGITPAIEQQRKRNRLYMWLGALLLVLAGIGIAYAIIQNNKSDDPVSTTAAQVTVPDMSDMDQTAARQALEGIGLKISIGDPVEDDKVESGKFVSSNPAPGESVAEGTTVTVHFSSGKGQVAVPDVTNGNYNQDQARTELEALGLEVGRVDSIDSPGKSRDTVVSTSPAAGTMVDKGSKVDLEIATGDIQLTDVRGSDVDTAKRLLADLKVANVTIEYVGTDLHPEGTVIEMSPLPGKVSTDVSVDLTVARTPVAPPTTEPPTTEPPTTEPPAVDDPTTDPAPADPTP